MIFEKTIVGIYKKNICVRQDGNPLLSYFSADDFPGLQHTPFDFIGNNGQKLQGYFYYYDNPRKDRLIIFDHGMGYGHVAYMKEIELIARRGYTVFTYDHTGCRESEGESIVGFAQSLCDLDYAVNAIRTVDGYKNATLSVIGHSWGGFAALNISALHKDIESCVSISGFIAVERIIEQFFPGILRFYRPSVLRLERDSNPMYSLIDARRSLKDTSARILYIASDNDPTVKKEYHYDSLVGNEKVELMLVCGKKHNPNYTEKAVAELTKMTDAMTAGLKKKAFKSPEDTEEFRTSWDWHKITEQDVELWGKIFDFIEGDSKK